MPSDLIVLEVMLLKLDGFEQVDLSRPGGEKHGAGLGLATVQEIVTAHSGRITVRSQEGLGTTFSVHLPLV